MKKQSMYSFEAPTVEEVAVAITDFKRTLPEDEHIVNTNFKLSKHTTGSEEPFYHITVETYTGNINDLLPSYAERRM